MATYLGLDPAIDVKWNLMPDDGSDIHTPHGDLIDTKTTFPHHRLIWSNTINHLYQQKRFDYLVSVSMVEGHFDRAWIEGFVAKSEFFSRKKVASRLDRLEPGTWYMQKEDLHDDLHDARLLTIPRPARRIISQAIDHTMSAPKFVPPQRAAHMAVSTSGWFR